MACAETACNYLLRRNVRQILQNNNNKKAKQLELTVFIEITIYKEREKTTVLKGKQGWVNKIYYSLCRTFNSLLHKTCTLHISNFTVGILFTFCP